jgi:D-glycero-D-manno-heptose 1,7-bisphosphate phosphatase
LGNRAVFLDRDGVICEDVNYLKHPSQVRLIPRANEAIRLLNERCFKVVVVTNQSGVARGYLTEEDVERVNLKMIGELGDGCHIDAIYYCPHHPDVGRIPYRGECDCRKPKPGMLKLAARDLDIDLSRSFMIGDKMGDVLAGHRAGCETVLVLTGRGRDEIENDLNFKNVEKRVKPTHVTSNIFEAVLIILNKRP